MSGVTTSESEVREQPKNIAKCCVCSRTYKNPLVLPCAHMLCVICLEEAGGLDSKIPGKRMPCPMCRKDFTIPKEGYAALQKTFFMEKPTEMATMASSSEGTDRCDDCMEDKRESTSVSEVPFADMHCTDCQRKLCQECCRYHLKNKLSKNHQVVAIADFKCKVQIVAPSNCIKHKRELDLYCSDCKEPICKVCFHDRIHQNHRLQDVRSTAEGFKNEIKDILSGLEMCMSEVSDKQEFLNFEVDEFCKHLESLKIEVLAQLRSIIGVASKQACLAIEDIEQLKVQKRKEVEAEVEDRAEDLTYLESFKVFCSKVMTKRSASDICYTIDELKERFEDIKKIHESDIERKIKTDLHRMSFQKSDLEEFVKIENYNIIGTIQECQTEVEDEAKTRSANDNISHDGDIKMERSYGMAISCKNGILAQINRLKQELNDSRRRIDGLEMEKKSLEKRIDEFRMELDMIRPLKPVSRLQMTQPVKPSCKDIPSRGISVDYTQTPNLVKRNQSANGMYVEAQIYGLAILGDELFAACYIVSSKKSIIEACDIETFKFKRFWHVEYVAPLNCCTRRIGCIASSVNHKCLYACIYAINDDQCQCLHETVIQKIDMRGIIGKEWTIKTGTRISNLSVSGEGTVIVITGTHRILEYTCDGLLIHEIKLPLVSGNIKLYPLHALKLANGNFVISHGQRKSTTTHEVLLLSNSGQFLELFGEKPSKVKEVPQVSNPRVLNKPVYLAVDVDGNILVVDRGNSRIVVLNSHLEFVCTIASAEPIGRPRCMCVDADRRQLFLCEGLQKIAVYDFSA